MGHVQRTSWFLHTLMGGKPEEEGFMLCENSMKVKCQCQTKLYWHTATPIHFHMDRAFFCASRTELAICCRDSAAHKAEKYDSLAFYKKRLSISDPENCLIKEETISPVTPREGTGASGGSCRGTAQSPANTLDSSKPL